MPKLIVHLILFLILSVANGQNQAVIIKTNLLNLPLHSASLYAEIKQNDKKSNCFMFSIGDPAKINIETRSRSFFTSLSYSKRTYFYQYKELSGFYYAPYAKYLYREQRREEAIFLFIPLWDSIDFNSHSLVVGSEVGFQHLIKNKVSIDIIGGLGAGVAFFTRGYQTRVHLDGKFGILCGYKF